MGSWPCTTDAVPIDLEKSHGVAEIDMMRVLYAFASVGEVLNEPYAPLLVLPAGGVRTNTTASPAPNPTPFVLMPVPIDVDHGTEITLVLEMPGMFEQEMFPGGGGAVEPAPACVTDAEAVPFTVYVNVCDDDD